MSRTNKWDARSIGGRRISGDYLGTMVQTLAGTLTMDRDMPSALGLDPGGATRVVLLPPEEEGLSFWIANLADAVEDLTIKEDSNTTTIGTISQGEIAKLIVIGGVWRIGVGTTT